MAGCAAAVGVDQGGNPLEGVAKVFDYFAIPSGWTMPAEEWIAERAEFLGTVAGGLVILGLFSLPGPSRLGRDLMRILEWRGPSTTVLSLAVMMQCGYLWASLIPILLCVVVRIVIVGSAGGDDPGRSEHAMIAAFAILLAVAFLPIYMVAWCYAVDAGRTAQRY
jgi:hypothetical protein